MFSVRGAGLVLIAAAIGGCGPSRPPSGAATTLTAREMSDAHRREADWRSDHPGTQVGVVNAAIPQRHILSVADIPLGPVVLGDPVTIVMEGRRTLEAHVYDKADGYLQLRYDPVAKGEPEPQAGDLAVWQPAAARVQ